MAMRMLNAIVVGAAVLLLSASTASADVQLTLKDGRVTLVAKDATVRQILAEWARVGQTKILNIERIPGGPVTLQFTELPEEEALDILLRSVSGYMAAPRPASVANLSRYDRIMVMPAAPAPRAAAAAPGPVFQQPSITPATPDDDDANPTLNPNPNQAVPTVVAPARGPIFQTFPQPQVLNPPAQGQPPAAAEQPATTAPTSTGSPLGVPRPGMVVQPPTAPGQMPTGQPPPGPLPPGMVPPGQPAPAR